MTTNVPPIAPSRGRPLRASALEHGLQRVLLALWVGVLPALLAGLWLRFCVPPAGTGVAGFVAQLGHRFTLPFGIGLFFLFSMMARYWRFRLPGGRYASALPAHLVPGERDGERLAAWAADAALYELAISGGMWRRLAKTLDAEKRAALEARLSDLRAAFDEGDAPRARVAAGAVGSMVAHALAAHRRRELVATIGATALAAAAAFGIRAVVAEPYQVLSASMLPTLEPGDRVGGNKLAYATSSRVPGRGDVVVFPSASVALPAGLRPPELLVKRVIGLPGDRVAVSSGQPIINGWPVPYCDAGEYVFLQSEGQGGAVHGRLRVEFLDDRAYLTVNAISVPFGDTYTVKPGEVFVLGDNRGNSVDSRAWNGGHGGGVPASAVDARVQWFLVGANRSGDADFGRFGRGIDRLEARLRLEGVDVGSIQDKIAACLSNRPANTQPPAPDESAGARASRDAQP